MSKNLFSEWDSKQTAFRSSPAALQRDEPEPDDDWPYDDDDDGNDVDGTFCFERAWIGLPGVTLDGESAKLMRDMVVHMVRIDAVWSDKSIWCFCDTARRVIEQRGKRFVSSDDEDTGYEQPGMYGPAKFTDESLDRLQRKRGVSQSRRPFAWLTSSWALS